jgi:hypothetical protein
VETLVQESLQKLFIKVLGGECWGDVFDFGGFAAHVCQIYEGEERERQESE